MAYMILLDSFDNNKGNLFLGTDKTLSFKIKRFYFLTNSQMDRGNCRHQKSIQAFVCINGSCRVYVNNGINEQEFFLNSPTMCLLVEKNDWHKIYEITEQSVIAVFSSTYYDAQDHYEDIQSEGVSCLN